MKTPHRRARRQELAEQHKPVAHVAGVDFRPGAGMSAGASQGTAAGAQLAGESKTTVHANPVPAPDNYDAHMNFPRPGASSSGMWHWQYCGASGRRAARDRHRKTCA